MDSKLGNIRAALQPFATKQFLRMGKKRLKFAHYTTPDVAVSILKQGTIWLRSTTKMNDYREIEWGQTQLRLALKRPGGVRFQNILKARFPELHAKIENFLNASEVLFRSNTYASSLTEHHPREDQFGRLSMWREYGKVAIVFDLAAVGAQPGTHIDWSPMGYFNDIGVARQLYSISRRLEAYFANMEDSDNDLFENELLQTIAYGVLANKHPGFREEREWRIFFVDLGGRNPLISFCDELIKEKQERVAKLSLNKLDGLPFSSLVDRFIIGPMRTEQITETRDRLIDAMQAQGWQNPAEKITVTDIPLRQE